jgi:hypothetical protein
MSIGMCVICNGLSTSGYTCPCCGEMIECCEEDRDAVSVDPQMYCGCDEDYCPEQELGSPGQDGGWYRDADGITIDF